jgi:N-acetylmuramoyl-L-alanine amidase
VYYFEQLTSRYAGHELADQALLHLGDLRRDGQKDEVGARAAYHEIIDRHAAGNKVKDAKMPREVSAGKDVFSERPKRKRPVIVIDPGHGGEDLGAQGVDGLLEKDVVLNIAFYLDELLRERLRAETLLTRARDIFVPLAERTAIANDNQANLFISIHANASPNNKLSGVETYYLDNTNDKSSLKLAERENQSLFFGDASAAAITDLQFILSDMIQNAKIEDSIALAHLVHDNLYNHLFKYYKPINNFGVKKAPFYVLVGAHMPCILVEVSFIDHPVEGRRLADRLYQKAIADALYRGIRAYFEKQE